MPLWEFNKADPSDVDVELTQRDQFNNDEVGLAEALVREAAQNSSDAPANEGQAVRLSFSFRTLSGSDLAVFRAHLLPLLPHLEVCQVNAEALEGEKVRVLAIEDFNTRGLTGAVDDLDDDNFRNFWRRHGKSSKGGRTGGRWGLGKLVYSSSSELRVFYGLTIREGETSPLLMGQAVLNHHEVKGTRYQAHGFWFAKRAENRLQLPISDLGEIETFRQLAGLKRTTEPGLSIAVPCVMDGIDETSLISAAVANYYFPILSGKLEIEVGDTLIDRHSFREVAAGIARTTDIPFGFVGEISERKSSGAAYVAQKPIGKDKLGEDFFSEDDLKAMKEAFTRGELVHASVPVLLSRKKAGQETGNIDLFLRPLPEGEKSFAIFARGPIILPGERKYFQNSPAFGAVVADGDAIAGFLGDAENPAHTAWNGSAEKLSRNWSNGPATLRSIRHALRGLYGLVADQVETEDKNALIDFFSLAEKTSSGKKRRSGSSRIRSWSLLPGRRSAYGRRRAASILSRARLRRNGASPGPSVSGWPTT